MNKHKELKEKYKTMTKPAGVFQIRNTRSGQVFIVAGQDVQAKMTSQRFQLKHGSHMNRVLQHDWSLSGEECFAFEVLELVKQEEGVQADVREDLRVMEKRWREKMKPGGSLY